MRYHRTNGDQLPRTVYKPAGIPVFPLHSNPDGDCVLHRLRARGEVNEALRWPKGFEGGIAHRLDISTSGALFVADNPEELLVIREHFASKAFVKTYRLRVAKPVPWDHNECERPIAHDRRRRARMIVQRGQSTPHRGKWHPAQTSFRRLHDDVFEATMRTGVMHQIRVHAAFLGIPLLGDKLYGGGASPALEGAQFCLHHVGLTGAGLSTEPVQTPEWARSRC